ncbi:hypothetical protein KDW_07120 [Dictyobacter vulcani]|uniref:Uncharacterized protein n=1 Tax=Dictyobacter vulcani TaxID=2607529 RepID=A0A5J4KJL5_9CHLR|nr:hypothetical protein [Dictyobacter vulcani]GER86550.1 hypothetical protein KDW_07120 [Dictyobacter vulcani]
MIAFSFDRSYAASSLEGETTAQVPISVFLGAIALCLGIGCLLFLPLTPPYQQIGAHYIAALLPLLIVWWAIVIPTVTYWLFQQVVATNRYIPQEGSTFHEPGVATLDRTELQPAYRWSAAALQQKQDVLIVHMPLQHASQTTRVGMTGLIPSGINSGDQTSCTRMPVTLPETTNTS